MYAASDDPYVYPGTDVLKNLMDIRDAQTLEAFELEMTTLRADEALPTGDFDPSHYRSIHRHLFQDVYEWAGEYRTIRTGKGGNWFCYPEYIQPETEKLFAGLSANGLFVGGSVDQFVEAAATFLSELNAIHPFREGNGRAQLAFMHELAGKAGHPLDLEKLRPQHFLQAMIASFAGELAALKTELAILTEQ